MEEKLFLLGLYVEEKGTFRAVKWLDDRILEGIYAANRKRFQKLVDTGGEELKRAEKSGFRILFIKDPEFPDELKTIPYPPLFLYLAGVLKPAIKIAIVGTRRPTPYGKEVTQYFSGELAGLGISIVSGFARGVDTIAHRSCLERGGHTVAVLGSGLDYIYPPENRPLFDAIISSEGAIVSEFPLGTRPRRENFPRRNRLISGLSHGVLVIEAGEKSGTLHTVRWAQEQGKEIFAVPGNIFSESSKGTHFLIREGAIPVTNPAEILEYLNIEKSEFPSNKQKDYSEPLSALEERILGYLSAYPVHFDELVELTDLPTSELLTVLSELEIKGLVKTLPGKFFQRI